MTRTYTSVPVRIVFGICGGLTGLLVGALLMGLVERTPFETPGLVVLVALVAAGVWRGAHVRVEVDPKGLVVHNLFRTHRVRWVDVLRVKDVEVMPSRGPSAVSQTPALVLRGRRRPLPLHAMTDLGDHRHRHVVKSWRRRYR